MKKILPLYLHTPNLLGIEFEEACKALLGRNIYRTDDQDERECVGYVTRLSKDDVLGCVLICEMKDTIPCTLGDNLVGSVFDLVNTIDGKEERINSISLGVSSVNSEAINIATLTESIPFATLRDVGLLHIEISTSNDTRPIEHIARCAIVLRKLTVYEHNTYTFAQLMYDSDSGLFTLEECDTKRRINFSHITNIK